MYEKVKSIIREKNAIGTLFVLKGFPVEEYGGERINLESVIANKVGRLFQLASMECQVISFEEFISLYDMVVLQYKKIIVLENPQYMNLYPVNAELNDDVVNSLLAHYDDDANGDTELIEISDYTFVYNNFVNTDLGIACCYNIGDSLLKSEKIERLVVRSANEEELTEIQSEDVPEDYTNLCNEIDYYQLARALETTQQKYVVAWESYISGKEAVHSALKYLNGLFDGRISTIAVASVSIEPNVHYPEVMGIMDKYWGYKSFRSLKTYDMAQLEKGNKSVVSISQEKIISDLIEQVERCKSGKAFKDIFVTAPTGAGKSLMFQLPAMYIGEKYNLVTLVITPLIGLMKDQVQALESKGYYMAKTINSDISPIIKQEILDQVANGECHILYLSPESLLSRSDIEALIGTRRIGMLVVDEAHIVTTWGKQFRPDYWYLGDHVQKLRRTQARNEENPMPFIIVTFTATAIYEGHEDMYHETLNSLHMIDPITYLGYVKRENIRIEIGEVEVKKNKTEYEMNKFDSLISIMNTAIMRNQKMLVYFPTVVLINRFGDYCYSKNLGNYVARYHGQMDADSKDENFNDFLTGKKLVMLATKAFGMGIDIPDIIIVAHFAPTGNVCDYMQEIGRAARDISIDGHAIYKHMSNDFQHINRLHGLSAIRPYQLVEVIKKILELYIAHRYGDGSSSGKYVKKRNEMLIDTESFAYIFDGPMSDDSNLINKVKTAMLLIQKDYENRGYAPFYMRPIPIFAYGYFALSPQTQRMINAKYYKSVEIKHAPLNICEVNLKKIWETSYEQKMSFPKFKFMLYSGSKDLDFNKKYSFSTAMSVEVYFEDNATQQFHQVFSAIKEATHLSIYQGKYYFFEELVNVIIEKSGLSKYKAESILNVVIAAMDIYRRDFAQKMYGRIYSSHANQNGRASYLFETPSREFFTWLEKGFRIVQENTLDDHIYVVNDRSGKNIKEITTLLGVYESFGVLRFKSLGGSNSQIYIYVNETKTMTMVRDKPYTYKNKLLELINYRHKESVKMLTYLFQNKLTSDQVWNHLENYFLGILPPELTEDKKKVDLKDLEQAPVQFQTGDSLTEDYKTWEDANILFDNEVVSGLNATNVPLADYYNAKLLIGDNEINVDLAWIDQKLLLTSGDEDEALRTSAKELGWICIPMEDISVTLIQSYFE